MHISSLSKVAEALIRSSLKSKDLSAVHMTVNTFTFDITLTAVCAGWSFEAVSNVGGGRSDLDFLWRLFDVEIESTSATVNGRLTCQRTSFQSKVNIQYSNRPLGHRIVVSNIFECLHVRRLSLNLSKELSQIQLIATALLMLHHEVSLHLSTDNATDTIFSIPTHNSVIDRYSFFHGDKNFRHITFSTKYLTVKGFITLAESQNGLAGQYAFIDGQYSESLTQSLAQAIRKCMISDNMKVSTYRERNGVPFVLSVQGLRNPSELSSEVIMELTRSLMKYLDSSQASKLKSEKGTSDLGLELKSSPQAADLKCFDIEASNHLEKVECIEKANASPISSPEAVLSLTVSRTITPIVEYFDRILLQEPDDSLREATSGYEDAFIPSHEEAVYGDREVIAAHGEIITGLNLESGDFDVPSTECNLELLDNDFLPSSKCSSKSLLPAGQPSELSVDRGCLQGFTCVGQFANAFILGTGSDGTLLCVDQHAADERVQLERIANGEGLDITRKETRETIELRHAELSVFRLHSNAFLRWGFQWASYEIHPVNGSANVTLLGVPVVCKEPLTSLDFLDFLTFLGRNPGLPADVIRPPAVQRIIASKACRSAVMFGDPLTVHQSEEILAFLAETSLPFQCAHGRPTMTPITNVQKLHASRARKLKGHPKYKYLEHR